MNERSLANLRLPKPPKEGHGYRYSLPQEKIDELFSYLAEDTSLKQSAKKANICFETAKKYFERGDEKRGIKPLKYRLTVFQDKISEKFNVLLEERRIKMLSTVREALKNIEERVKNKKCKCCEGEGSQVGKDGIKQLCPACNGEGIIIGALIDKSNIKDLERLMRLEVFLLGGVMQKEKESKFLSAEEISGGDPSQE
jgi:Zn finger protein HypA/HybF involved in hydrogenase expression